MKLYLLSLINYIAITSTAVAQVYQSFPTAPASWEVSRCWYFYPGGWHDEYTLATDGSDTIYDGLLYKKISISHHHAPGTAFDTIYPTQFFGGFREFNKQIFIFQKWASVDTTAHLVYDFNNSNIGDTIFTSALSGPPTILLGHIITGVDSVMIGLQYNKRLHLQDPDNVYNTEDWIEGVGSSWGLPFASFWSITDNSYDLTCFYEMQQLMYSNPSPTYSYCLPPLPQISCDSVGTFVPGDESEKIMFSMWPNPASDIVNLNINNSDNRKLKLNIYNVMGTLVQSEILKNNKQEITIGDLSNGVYIVVLNCKDFIVNKKLIIQK